MHSLITSVEEKYKKPKLADVQSGDTVRVHQRIKEGNKERVQVFEGLVIRTNNMNSLTARILVRRIASGVGVEKSFLMHSPLVEKIEVVKRSKVRRNYLRYMRQRRGKSARLSSVDFDKEKVNDVFVPEDTTKEAKEAEVALAEVEKENPEAEAHAQHKEEKKVEKEAAAEEKPAEASAKEEAKSDESEPEKTDQQAEKEEPAKATDDKKSDNSQ